MRASSARASSLARQIEASRAADFWISVTDGA
jgi:hypothetical protein